MLLVVDDVTASTPPRALHTYRKTLSRDHLDFYHGLLGLRGTEASGYRVQGVV